MSLLKLTWHGLKSMVVEREDEMNEELKIYPKYSLLFTEIHKLREQLEIVQNIGKGLAKFSVTEGDILLLMEKENDILQKQLDVAMKAFDTLDRCDFTYTTMKIIISKARAEIAKIVLFFK